VIFHGREKSPRGKGWGQPHGGKPYFWPAGIFSDKSTLDKEGCEQAGGYPADDSRTLGSRNDLFLEEDETQK
jgi:hypothetical protein